MAAAPLSSWEQSEPAETGGGKALLLVSWPHLCCLTCAASPALPHLGHALPAIFNLLAACFQAANRLNLFGSCSYICFDQLIAENRGNTLVSFLNKALPVCLSVCADSTPHRLFP